MVPKQYIDYLLLQSSEDELLENIIKAKFTRVQKTTMELLTKFKPPIMEFIKTSRLAVFIGFINVFWLVLSG